MGEDGHRKQGGRGWSQKPQKKRMVTEATEGEDGYRTHGGRGW